MNPLDPTLYDAVAQVFAVGLNTECATGPECVEPHLFLVHPTTNVDTFNAYFRSIAQHRGPLPHNQVSGLLVSLMSGLGAAVHRLQAQWNIERQAAIATAWDSMLPEPFVDFSFKYNGVWRAEP